MNLGKNETLRSGDDVGQDITCHNCGELFREGVRDHEIVNCPGCGGRLAYIERLWHGENRDCKNCDYLSDSDCTFRQSEFYNKEVIGIGCRAWQPRQDLIESHKEELWPEYYSEPQS